MWRAPTVLGILTTAGFLLLGTPSGHAQAWQAQPQAESGVADWGRNKLNQGMARQVAVNECQQVGADRHADFTPDPNVVGTDHSKLNHGVLGAQKVKIPPLSAWATPAEIVGKGSIGEAAGIETAAQGQGENAKAETAPGTTVPTPHLSTWAPPAEITGRADVVEHSSATKIEPVAQPPGEIAKVEASSNRVVSASTILPLSTWAPPAEIAAQAQAAVGKNGRLPEAAAKVESVLDAAVAKSNAPPHSGWAPPAEIADKIQSGIGSSAANIEPAAQHPGKTARFDAALDAVVAELAMLSRSASAPPLRGAGNVRSGEQVSAGKIELAWQPPAEIVRVNAGQAPEAAQR